MCKTIAVCNQKGGVGKTTTTISLGVGLASMGYRVLLVDADPQGDMTSSLGWKYNDEIECTLATKMAAIVNDMDMPAAEGILHHPENIDLIPANIELTSMEMLLINAMSRELVLRRCLEPLYELYDYILIDCMPSLGMVTINALAAADSVIVPVQAHYLAAKGMTELFKTVARVKKGINPKLQIEGIVLTLAKTRANLTKATKEALYENYGGYVKIYDTIIPDGIRAAEASASGKSIYAYEPGCNVAKAYIELTKEVFGDGNR